MLQREMSFYRIFLIAILALAVRIAYIFWVSATLGFDQESDAWYIHEIAKSLAAGDGFTLEGTRIYNQSPGYPYLLSLLYRLFGDSAIVLAGLNIVLASSAAVLTVVLTMRVMLSDKLPEALRPHCDGMLYAVVALTVFAPANWLYIPMAAAENLLVPLLALFLLIALCPERPRIVTRQGQGEDCDACPYLRGLLAGVVMAACLSVKAYAIFIAPLPLLLWLGRGRRFYVRAVALYGLATLALLTPWTVKNYHDSGGYIIPFAAVSGEVFLDSNNPMADGRPSNVLTLPEIEARDLDPIARDKAKLQAGLDFLRNDPAWAARLQWRKLVYSFSPVRDFMFEHRQRYRLFNPFLSRYAPTLFNALMLLGFLSFLILHPKRNVVWLTGLACFGVPLVLQQIFAAYTRYRYPFLYIGLVFAVMGWALGIQKTRNWRQPRERKVTD